MKIIDETIKGSALEAAEMFADFYPKDEILMFDIETTGLSPDRAFIYLIGLGFYSDGQWQIRLLFNDDGSSEPKIIETFMDMLKRYKYLIHFNGDRFDIPFVKRRMDIIRTETGKAISGSFNGTESVDLLKLIRPLKKSLGLPNIKQKTVERYFGVNRTDIYNGGQLIEVYLGYLRLKNDPDAHKERELRKDLFIQHNRDDMEGMYYLSGILSLREFASGNVGSITADASDSGGRISLVFKGKTLHPLPTRICIKNDKAILIAEGSVYSLKTDIFTGRLNYYFSRREGSMSEREGCFIVQPSDPVIAEYKLKAKDKASYLEINDMFLGNSDLVHTYTSRMISEMTGLKQ